MIKQEKNNAAFLGKGIALVFFLLLFLSFSSERKSGTSFTEKTSIRYELSNISIFELSTTSIKVPHFNRTWENCVSFCSNHPIRLEKIIRIKDQELSSRKNFFKETHIFISSITLTPLLFLRFTNHFTDLPAKA